MRRKRTNHWSLPGIHLPWSERARASSAVTPRRLQHDGVQVAGNGANLLRPFAIPNLYRDPVRRSAFAAARPVIERVLSLRALNDIHEAATLDKGEGLFAERILRVLRVTYELSESDLSRIPREGPLIVVSNHPFGGLDGLVLLAMLQRVRPEAKVLANYFLGRVLGLRDSMFLVDPFGRPDSLRRNVSSIRQAIEFVREGGVLGVFPAGEVAHASLRNRHVLDPQWSRTIARMVQTAAVPVLPVFMDGRNSGLFQLAGILHPRLRTVMLPRETLKRRRSVVHVRVGNQIPTAKLKQFPDVEELTAYLRVRTHVLKGRVDPNEPEHRRPAPEHKGPMGPIAVPTPRASLRRDLAALPESSRILSNSDIEVYVARSGDIPNMLKEIGRERERAFRVVGEGTGQTRDIDRFDAYYVHLFAWDRKAERLVGAYRLGLTDEILPKYGVRGLYTRTLFRFRPRLIDQINPALELGRSFVVPEYQKAYAPLLLLWKGIGRFISLHPKYRMMFGPVSISNEYHSMSQHLLASFLQMNRYLPSLGRQIRPKCEPRFAPFRDWDPKMTGRVVRDLEDVDELIGEIEADRLSVPILLRQYLKLDARLLGFNVDPEFGDVVDGLMLVDVAKINRRVLTRYIGPDRAPAFLAYHGMDA